MVQQDSSALKQKSLSSEEGTAYGPESLIKTVQGVKGLAPQTHIACPQHITGLTARIDGCNFICPR
jgi:hypothetical protein